MIRAAIVAILLAAPARAGQVPDPKLTPGVVIALTTAEVCSRKWGLDRRHVTAAMRRHVLTSYRVKTGFKGCAPDAHGRRVELDHLIPRQLGGADEVKNLWPECRATKFNATMKDRLENAVHKLVCSGQITLKQGQNVFFGDCRMVEADGRRRLRHKATSCAWSQLRWSC